MSDQGARQRMLACEARYWLRRGRTTPEKVTELREKLKRRGDGAVEQLVTEMRRQWLCRGEWKDSQEHDGDSSRGASSSAGGTLEATR